MDMGLNLAGSLCTHLGYPPPPPGGGGGVGTWVKSMILTCMPYYRSQCVKY